MERKVGGVEAAGGWYVEAWTWKLGRGNLESLTREVAEFDLGGWQFLSFSFVFFCF